MSYLSDCYKAVKITDHVSWVGAIDWDIRDFHGYATPRGTTYNAYLVQGEKVALVDTVKPPFAAEMWARVASLIDPARIDYIVSNHAEWDHSGSLPEAIAVIKPERVVASTNGVSALQNIFHFDREITPVNEGETLDLGGLTFTFVEARMLHWPDNMMTYLGEEKVLLSNDAFGMHLATSERFHDQVPEWILDYEAAKYYANILLPFSPLITRQLEKASGLGLRIDTIAPSHGPVWRDPAKIVGLYSGWAAGKTTRKALVVFDSMWGATAKMALAIAQGLIAEGVSVKVMSLKANHRSDVAAELLDAQALVVGSPTLNNNLFPSVADLLAYLKGLRPRNLVGAVFGSFGWSGEATKLAAEALTAMKVDLAADPVTVKLAPDHAALCACVDLGRTVAQRMEGKHGQ